jgi:hypothetical protein
MNHPVEQVIAAIQALDLEPVKRRVMDAELGEGWTREYAEGIERAYRTYLTMLVKHPDKMEDIAVSKDVDEFWHTHILHTMKYTEDCEKVFGKYLHHNPHIGERTRVDIEKKVAQTEATRRLYQQEFGIVQDREAVWSGVPQEAAENAAFCGASVRANDAAFCGASIRAERAAFCGASVRANDAAFCGASIRAERAAFCGASVKPEDTAFCGASVRANDAAFCGASIRAERAAFCGASVKPEDTAFCGASAQADDAAFCGASIAEETGRCEQLAVISYRKSFNLIDESV